MVHPIVKKQYRFLYPYDIFGRYILISDYVYKKLQGKGKHIWLVPVNNDPSMIHVHTQSPSSQGYGGSNIEFKIDDGSIYMVKGPWRSNTEDLFLETGLDLRKNHETFGIIALDRRSVKHKPMQYDYFDVLHMDDGPVIGEFDRIEKMAQIKANDLNKNVYYQVQTAGGGQIGMACPQNI